MRLLRWSSVLVLALFLAWPVAAGAQGRGPERLRVALEETSRRIAVADEAILASGDEQARGDLARARALQARAMAAASAGRPLVAGQLTIEARGYADRATEAAGLPDPDRVLGQLERTRATLDRAGERIAECGDDRARDLLRVAREMQDRAESAERGQRHLGALQLTMGARERGLRALRLCRVEENVQELAKQALAQTDLVLSRARSRRPPGPPGREVRPRGPGALDGAVALQEDAVREFRHGRFEESLQRTLAARRLAHRAVGRGPRGF